MNGRDLFSELSTDLTEARRHDRGALSLETHGADISEGLVISPDEIQTVRLRCRMSRQEFAWYLRTSPRTLASWEQGRTRPNNQAVVLLFLIKNHPETLAHLAGLSA